MSSVKKLAYLQITMYTVFGALLLAGFIDVQRLSNQVKNAFCNFKEQTEVRIAIAEGILEDQTGDVVFYFNLEIPREQLQASLARDKALLASVASLDCGKKEEDNG